MATAKKQLRGFAVMSPDVQKRIAAMGGIAAHAEGRAHTFTSEEARSAGAKGQAARRAKRDAALKALQT